nr:MAG TPA: hypothetical protein [Caudoviricetes sp.]
MCPLQRQQVKCSKPVLDLSLDKGYGKRERGHR